MDKDVEYYSAIKKNKNWPFTTMWMGLKDITDNEISQTEEDKYCIFFTYMWNLKNKMNENNNKKKVHVLGSISAQCIRRYQCDTHASVF